MKKTILSVFFTGFISLAFSQVDIPAPSLTQHIKQDFGLSSIELTYSRPSLRGRDMIGVAVPWGILWRTGANAATKIKFNDPVEILGHQVEPGSYAIYTIPAKNGDWTFVLNKGFDNSGVTGYKESEDVFRQKIKAGKNKKEVESLTMQFADLRRESCVLKIKWENFILEIPIKVDITDELRAQVEKALQSDKKPYWQAAHFYAEWDNNNAKALEMMNAAISKMENPPFYMLYYKAVLQKDLGDKAGALKTAQKSLELSKVANDNAYIFKNEKLIKNLK